MNFCLSIAIVISHFFASNLWGTPIYVDETFGTNGSVITVYGTQASLAAAVIQSNDYIVAAGNTDTSIAVARYTNSGSLDSSFGSGGLTSFSVSAATSASATDVVLDASGDVIIVGNAFISNTYELLVARLLGTDGSLDSSFGTSGTVAITLNGSVVGASVAIQPADGKIVVAGAINVSGQLQIFSLRLLTNGTLDTSWGSSSTGIVYDMVGYHSGVNDLVIQSDGSIVVAGWGYGPDNKSDFMLIRYDNSGNRDTTFGTDGLVTTGLASVGTDVISSIALQSDGSIVAAGKSNTNIAVARYTSSGVLDTTNFNPSGSFPGAVITSVSSISDAITSLIVQPSDQKIVIAGGTMVSSSMPNLLALRFTTSGALDSTFGAEGVVTLSLGSKSKANALGIQSTNELVLVGYSDNSCALAQLRSNNSDFVTITSPANGSTISSFVTPISGKSSQANAQVQITVNSTAYTTVTTDNYGNWSTPTSAILEDGSNTISVNLIYNSTTVATASTTFTASATHAITITNPANGSNVFSGTTTFTGTSDIDAGSVSVTLDGVAFATVNTDSSGNWSTGASPLMNVGSHTVTVTGTPSGSANSTFSVLSLIVIQGAFDVTGGIGTGGNGVGFSYLITSSNSVTVTYTAAFPLTPTIIATGVRSSGTSTVTIASSTTSSTVFSFTSGTSSINFAAVSAP